ncbi:MAG TPA: DMT family transporter [Gemmatimonadaceae bacterium]|nr:DMT family transporter [Gemmatimonadaceae bacterium]
MRARPALVLLVALLGISTAGPLVRLSHADPLAIASWRLAFSLLVVGAALARSGGWRQWARLRRGDLAVAVGAGVLLALHFWSWNASIGLTTIAASVVLVNMQPAFVALASAAWLHERPERRQAIGIGVAIAGAFVVALPDLLASHPAGGAADPILGDLLALVGAVTAALYYAAGRRLRQTLDLWPYVGLVYGACLVTLLAISLSRGVRLVGLPGREYAIFAALAAGPMLLGHTGMNWALKFLPAYVVNLTVLGEPVGATLLAALIPGIGERPTIATLVGGALLLGGVLATSGRARVRAAASAPAGAG